MQSGRLVPLFDERRASSLSYFVVSPPAATELATARAVRDWLLDEAEEEDAAATDKDWE
jgi:hypothetical protein